MTRRENLERRLAALRQEKAHVEQVKHRIQGLKAELDGRPSVQRLLGIQREVRQAMQSSPHLKQSMGRIERGHRWRRVRRWLLLVVIVVVAAEFAGTPHLRINYTYTGSSSNKSIQTARYLGLTGWRHARAGRYAAEGCPLFVLIKPQKPLRERAFELARVGWSRAQEWIEARRRSETSESAEAPRQWTGRSKR